jgi:hypothetical protein
LFTEDINHDNIIRLANLYFDGFTAYKANGYWKGQAEPSCVIETITDNTKLFYKLANAIKTINKQESVLVEIIANHAKFI